MQAALLVLVIYYVVEFLFLHFISVPGTPCLWVCTVRATSSALFSSRMAVFRPPFFMAAAAETLPARSCWLLSADSVCVVFGTYCCSLPKDVFQGHAERITLPHRQITIHCQSKQVPILLAKLSLRLSWTAVSRALKAGIKQNTT